MSQGHVLPSMLGIRQGADMKQTAKADVSSSNLSMPLLLPKLSYWLYGLTRQRNVDYEGN